MTYSVPTCVLMHAHLRVTRDSTSWLSTPNTQTPSQGQIFTAWGWTSEHHKTWWSRHVIIYSVVLWGGMLHVHQWTSTSDTWDNDERYYNVIIILRLCVLMLKCMCPHVSSRLNACLLMIATMCPHVEMHVSSFLCNHVSSRYNERLLMIVTMCPHV